MRLKPRDRAAREGHEVSETPRASVDQAKRPVTMAATTHETPRSKAMELLHNGAGRFLKTTYKEARERAERFPTANKAALKRTRR